MYREVPSLYNRTYSGYGALFAAYSAMKQSDMISKLAPLLWSVLISNVVRHKKMRHFRTL
ncbi:unnamed protein product [Chondrus crispus]|uniref:Uncharacterized protein n=1 Tax=Chondrus crispus TaxID=2769 RepID=R7QAA2_CHOCR|nr:unnamed protein product [Chondrus crispus]CDF34969.1 unnamed protein product [Chondrus crispus]|eukprot:XP_005714788.1 unnamed protein product [Chondrus crispus]